MRASQTAVLGVVLVLVLFAIVRGGSMFFEGAERWQEGSHAVALLLPGAPPTWGVALFVSGLVGLVALRTGRYRLLFHALYGTAFWCTLFTVAFVASVAQNPNAAGGGIWTYSFFALLYVVAGTAVRESYWRTHPKKRG